MNPALPKKLQYMIKQRRTEVVIKDKDRNFIEKKGRAG